MLILKICTGQIRLKGQTFQDGLILGKIIQNFDKNEISYIELFEDFNNSNLMTGIMIEPETLLNILTNKMR